MKFTIQSASELGRLGIISNLARLPEFKLETPHILLYTKGGTVPHLTYEVLQWVSDKNQGLSIPVQSVHHVQEQMKVYQKSIADYIGMKEYLTYCSYINPLEEKTSANQKKSGVYLWTRNGRKQFTAKSYMELIDNLKPDMFLLLADNNFKTNYSEKKIKNSFNKLEKYFEDCMEIYKKSNTLKSSQVLASIQGGYNVSLREEASKLIGKNPVFGVVIDGLHECNKSVAEMTIQDVEPFVKASLKHIPHEQLRIIHGCWNPSVLLYLVELGIDLFDSSYLTSITEQHCAFIFPNTQEILEQCQSNDCQDRHSQNEAKNNTSEVLKSELDEPELKKMKMENLKFCVSMKNNDYITDFKPILQNCTCLTCRNHTRAYIHHLLTVKELLGLTLLMIHNLHHYLLFLSTIRQALKSGRFQVLKKQFQNWLDNLPQES